MLHLILHLPNEIEPPTRRAKYDFEPRTIQWSNVSFRSSRTTWPSPKRRRRDTRQYRHSIRRIGQESPMGDETRTAYPTSPRQAMYTDNFIIRHLKLDIANPESQPAITGDVDASDGVVPEPCHGDHVPYGDGDDCSVCSDGDGEDEDTNEDCFEEEESQFKCKAKGRRSKRQQHRSIICNIRQRLRYKKRIVWIYRWRR
mmetsp:Transcript_25453/g.41383  ORF Transcript_25453/g.41383 Transcript_25453/m.41383 type:complete len:200 (-) Transcript_25453:112-711(-)